MKLRSAIVAMLLVLALVYPVVVFWGLNHFPPRYVALGVGVVFLSRLFRSRPRALRPLILPTALCVGVSVWAMASDDDASLLLLPVFVSVGFLAAFVWTMIRPPAIVELFARLVADQLSDAEIRYCRTVTQIWVVFFVFNGTVAYVTATHASREVWVIYNGLISYLLIGCLFTAELVYRHWRFRHYVGLPTDRIFKKLFPPHDAKESDSN